MFNILEQINTPIFPIVIPECSAFSLWHAEKGDKEQDWQIILRIKPPKGGRIEFPTNFKFTAERHRIAQRLQGVPIERAGKLHFELIINGEHAAQHTITIKKVDKIDITPIEIAGEKNP